MDIDCISLDELYLIMCTFHPKQFWRFKHLISLLPFKVPEYPDYQSLTIEEAARKWRWITHGGSHRTYAFSKVHRWLRPASYPGDKERFFGPPFPCSFTYFGRKTFPKYIDPEDDSGGCLWLSIATTIPKLLWFRGTEVLDQIAHDHGLTIHDNHVYAIQSKVCYQDEDYIDENGRERTCEHRTSLPEIILYRTL